MFARASTAFVLALPLLAAASAIPRDGGNQCNVGAIQCCNSSQTAESLAGSALGGLLGLLVGPIEGLIGLNCSPITVIGASGSSCTAQPVCCTNNNFNGLVALGCTPININL